MLGLVAAGEGHSPLFADTIEVVPFPKTNFPLFPQRLPVVRTTHKFAPGRGTASAVS
jgi:hypothetical protein